jgi:hypothetical protein
VACVALTAAPALADQIRNEEWWLSALHVTTAQESSKGSGVTVAVLDTGVDSTQPDLAGSVTTGPDFTRSGRTAGGPFWGIHGTAVASLIAGHGHGSQNGDGIIGVAPEAKILSVRVTLESNDPDLANASTVAALPGAIADGIRYAVSHGAQVIDLPLDPASLASTAPAPSGVGATPPPDNAPGGSTAEREAVAYALSKNVVLVAPAGERTAKADPVNYPAAYPGVISVGAFNQNFTKASFTTRQPYVTLTAAGDGVIAATPSGYAVLHSTTGASAVVAGIAALIKAQFPTLSPAQVTSALTQSTVFRPPGGRKDGSGFGTADAQAALLQAAHINAAVPAHSGSGAAAVAPSAPPVHPHGMGAYVTVRSAALGLAALLLLCLLGFILRGPARRRRARAARLAPLRDAALGAVRAQPNLSAGPTAPGSQFGESQFAGSQVGGNQFAGSTFADARFGQAKFGESQLGETPFPGDQYPEAPFPGDQYTETPFPGDPAEAPFPGGPVAQAPFTGDTGTQAPFPGDQYPETPFPGDPMAQTPFPPAPVPPGPLSGGSFAEPPLPSTDVSETGPFPAVPPANGTPGRTPPRPVSPTPRSHLVRPPRIVGNPPWEPAEKPDGELPWAVTPPTKSVGRPATARRVIPTGVQPWGPASHGDGSRDDADAGGTGFDRPGSESMFPDSEELGGRVPGSMPLPAPDGEPADEDSDDEDGSKLYVWNPAEVTEAFPKVPPGESGPRHRK